MSEAPPRVLDTCPDDVTPRIPNDHPVQELSASCKLIYLALQSDGPLTRNAIAKWAGMPKRTVRFGLDHLDEADVIEYWTSLRDNRKLVYDIIENGGDD